MKPLRSFICCLLIASQAFAGITYNGTAGQTLYARVQLDATTYKAVALTEGSSGGLGTYSCTDSAIFAAGVNSASPGRGFNFTVRSGSPSTMANDPIVGAGELPWTGSGELPQLNVGVDGSVATSNRGYMADVAKAMPWTTAPAVTYYVRPTGDDGGVGTDPGDPFLTIAAAIAARNSDGQPNGKIDIAGLFNISSQLAIPANTWLVGDGSPDRGGTTEIRSSTTANGCAVTALDNAVLQGFKITTTSTTAIAPPIGVGSPQVPSRNVSVIDVDTSADSDGVLFNAAAGINNSWWRFYNCHFAYKWDGATIVGEGAATIVSYFNCTWTQTGASTIVGASDARAITGTGGRQCLFNCTINDTVHPSGKLACPVYTRGTSVVELHNCVVNGPASQPTDGYDMLQSDRSKIVVYGNTRSVASGQTSGTIIDGESGLDWAKLRSPLATKALTNTTISSSQQVANGGGGTAVAPFLLDDSQTWSFDNRDQITSPDILTETVGEAAIYKAVNFSLPLTKNGAIQSINSVTVADVAMATEPTITMSQKSADGRSVYLTIDASAATAATYTISISITTTDSRTFTRKVKLQLQ